MIRHTRVLAAPFSGDGGEKRLTGRTSRTGLSTAISDGEDIPQRLVEIEWRGESILIHRERSMGIRVLSAEPFGQPDVDVRQSLLVPADEGVAKLAPAHAVVT